jgi:hypothetical protein
MSNEMVISPTLSQISEALTKLQTANLIINIDMPLDWDDRSFISQQIAEAISLIKSAELAPRISPLIELKLER